MKFRKVDVGMGSASSVNEFKWKVCDAAKVKELIDIANRDENIFSKPDELDLHREGARHVAFGFGMHQCLGQALARVEIQVALQTLISRIPTLCLASPQMEFAFRQDGTVCGLDTLMVGW